LKLKDKIAPLTGGFFCLKINGKGRGGDPARTGKIKPSKIDFHTKSDSSIRNFQSQFDSFFKQKTIKINNLQKNNLTNLQSRWHLTMQLKRKNSQKIRNRTHRLCRWLKKQDKKHLKNVKNI